MTSIIYADLKCIIEKIDGYENNPENSSPKKKNERIYSIRVFNDFIIFF